MCHSRLKKEKIKGQVTACRKNYHPALLPLYAKKTAKCNTHVFKTHLSTKIPSLLHSLFLCRLHQRTCFVFLKCNYNCTSKLCCVVSVNANKLYFHLVKVNCSTTWTYVSCLLFKIIRLRKLMVCLKGVPNDVSIHSWK